MSNLIFSVKGSVEAELKRFKSILATDPSRGKQIYSNGEKLIVLAGGGELNQFRRFASEINEDDILVYFSAKALMASLIGGHLVLSGFIVDNGYPLQLAVGLPNILNDCLRELCDYECVPIVKLLVEKGLDVNVQEQKTWLAPLHIAVKRELVDTMHELVNAGADVNIVGEEDVMPLQLAEKLPNSSVEKQHIVEFLSSRGARLTWRRQEKPGNASSLRNNYFNTEFTTNTQIRAGPTNSSCSKPDVNAAPSPATAAPVCTHKVRFNGSQLSAIPAAAAGPVPLPSTALSTAPTTSGNSNSSATNKKVSFNGANIVLEQITLPVPPPRPVPARSSTGLPIPKVSVSTASGEKLRPPPRVVVAAGDSTDTVATDYEGGDNGGEVEVPPAITAEVGQNAGNAERAETGDEKEFSSVGEGVGRIDVSSAHLGSAEEEEEEEEGRQWTVGSFQMSEDGTAMLFSTG